MPDLPDNTVPTTTSDDVPNQIEPSHFAQYMNAASQQANQPPVQTSPQSQPQPTPEQQDAALETHPATQNAKLLYKVGETLAGGPQVKTTYNEDGSVTREKVPLTTKQVLTGALANILGSFGQVSSNLSNRMQGRAPKPIQPLPTQVAQQQRDQQSQEDWDRVQNQKVRQAKVLTANMEAARVAYGLAHEEEQAKQAEVASHAPDLANWQKSGVVEGSGLDGSEIMRGNQFPKADYFFVPDGVVPLYRNGERVKTASGIPASTFTYSAIKGSAQAELTQDKYDQFVKYGLMKPSKPLSDQGDTFRLPEGSTISGPTLALMNYKVGLVNQLQRELDSVHSAVGGDPVNLPEEIRKNPRLLSSVEQWHNADAGIVDDPVRQLASLKASKNPKAQSAADNIAALFGPANLDKWIAKQAGTDFKNIDDARKKLADDAANVKINPANGIVTYSGTDSSVQDAANYINLTNRQETGQKAGQKQAETNAGGKDADIEFAAKSLANGILPA